MVMTSENSQIVASRMKKLKIEDVYLGVKDKYSLLSRIVTDRKLIILPTLPTSVMM